MDEKSVKEAVRFWKWFLADKRRLKSITIVGALVAVQLPLLAALMYVVRVLARR